MAKTASAPEIRDLRRLVTGRALTLVDNMLNYRQSDGWIFKETDCLAVLKHEFAGLRERRNCGRRTEAEILLALWVLGIDLVAWNVLPGRYKNVDFRFKALLENLSERSNRLRRLVRAKLKQSAQTNHKSSPRNHFLNNRPSPSLIAPQRSRRTSNPHQKKTPPRVKSLSMPSHAEPK